MSIETNPVVSSLKKTESAEVRVSRSTWKGRRVVDIRIWYKPKGGDEFVPSRKGLTIDAKKLPELMGLLTEAA
jgi:Transcriptional Coactivator p15 (PC4)